MQTYPLDEVHDWWHILSQRRQLIAQIVVLMAQVRDAGATLWGCRIHTTLPVAGSSALGRTQVLAMHAVMSVLVIGKMAIQPGRRSQGIGHTWKNVRMFILCSSGFTNISSTFCVDGSGNIDVAVAAVAALLALVSFFVGLVCTCNTASPTPWGVISTVSSFDPIFCWRYSSVHLVLQARMPVSLPSFLTVKRNEHAC